MKEKKFHLVWKDTDGKMVEDFVTAESMEVDKIGIEFVVDTPSPIKTYVVIFWSDYPSMMVYDF